MIKVRVVRRKGMNALIQWEDQYGIPHRSWFPQAAFLSDDGDFATVSDPSHGILDSENWSKYIEITATPEDVEIELKRRNIWRFEDIDERPNDVLGALMNVYGSDLTSLRLARSNK